MRKCPFCDKKNLKKHAIIHEDKNHLVFFSKHPVNLGHTLVIPKKHVRSLLSLTGDETGELFKLVRQVAKKLHITLKPDGLDIGNNYGKIAGQTVNHLHVHVIPRFEGDFGFLQLTTHGAPYPIAERDQQKLAQKLKSSW